MNFFKIAFFCLAAAFLFSSCSKCVDTNLIFGNWKDTHDYPISYFDANGDSVFSKFPNIIYHIEKDGSYSIENEVPLGIPCNGNFSFLKKAVTFRHLCSNNETVPIIGLDGKARFKNFSDASTLLILSWDLLTLNENEMEVNFIYTSIPLNGTDQKFNTSYKRKFIRIK